MSHTEQKREIVRKIIKKYKYRDIPIQDILELFIYGSIIYEQGSSLTYREVEEMITEGFRERFSK
jgi:hypothetical protein